MAPLSSRIKSPSLRTGDFPKMVPVDSLKLAGERPEGSRSARMRV